MGCETAEFLVSQGCQVTIVTDSPASDLAGDAVVSYRTPLLGRLQDAGVSFITKHEVRETRPDGLVIADKDGKVQSLDADLIVAAEGSVAESAPMEGLQDRASEVHFVGDYVEPGNIADALYKAALLASRI